jgi:hypothetical protein
MRWSKELLRENERGLPALTWIVDEASGQLIVFWATVISGKGHLERIAYDLATGAEKWRFNDPWGDDFVGGVLDATLDGNSVAAWGRYGYETHRVKWWRWHYDEGFLFPETETTSHERPLRIRYLCATGTMTDRTEIERADERIQRILTARDSAAKVLFLREMKARQQMEPWRAVRLPAGGALGGPAASLDFPGYAVLTPGGRIVVAGDLMQRREMWRITVW